MRVKSGGESGTVLGNWSGDDFENGQELRSDKEGRYTLGSRVHRELGFMPRASCLTFKAYRQPQVVQGLNSASNQSRTRGGCVGAVVSEKLY
jgi:hypothetical protein